jgi:two-component system nitrogen regulation sensor histidine kinase NtrY
MADVQQMEQALINIVKNAIESIGNNGVIEFIG